jgi:hypothetical protein
LRCGVELHELRPDAAFVRREWTWLRGHSEAELHTKAVELAILVESPALAAKVASFISAGMSLAAKWRLSLPFPQPRSPS